MSRFDRLYRDNFPFVWAAAHRCGAPADAVDDVVQDVFVTAYRRLEELSWEVSPRGWLYGVTRKVAFRYRRSAARTARRNTAVAAASNRSARPHRQQEAAHALEKLLEGLGDAQREVFVMTEMLGLSAPEIAAELEVPVNTVYSRLRLARKRLVELAGEQGVATRVRAAKAADKPSAEDRRRVHAAMLPLLGSSWTVTGPALLGAAKAAVLPALVAVVAVTTYGITVASRSDADTEDEVATAPKRSRDAPYGRPDSRMDAQRAAAVAPGRAEGTARLPQEASAVAPASIEPGQPLASPDMPATAQDRGPNPARPATVGAPPEGPAAAEATPAESVATPSAPADSLAAEVALLDDARAQLEAGRAQRALSALDEHARRFPRGQLADAQLAHRVRALCKLGRTSEAERAAGDLHRSFPQSTLVDRTPKRCGDS